MASKLFSPKIITVSILTACLSISGCQSTSEKFVEEQQQNQQNNEQFLISKKAIDTLAQRFIESKENNLAFFAADLVNDAKENQEDANDYFDAIRFSPQKATSSKTQSILSKVSKANQYLDQAVLIKNSAEKILAKSFIQISTLKALNADKLYVKEFKKSQQKLSDLIDYIVDGKIDKAQEYQAKLLPLLSALEVKTVKHIELAELRTLLSSLKKSKVHKVAPISYNKAIGLSQSAESVISANPKDIAAIKDSVALATFEAKHTQNIAIEVRNLAAIKKNYEGYILDFENKLNSVSQALKKVNLRDQILSAQTISLVSQGNSLNAQLAEQKKKITDLELSIANKDELLVAATSDSESFTTMITAKLKAKNEEISLQNTQISKLSHDLQSLELKLASANQTVTVAKQQLEQLANQHELTLAKNELSSSSIALTTEKKLLDVEKQMAALQAKLTDANESNAKLKNEKETLTQTISNLESKVATPVIAPVEPSTEKPKVEKVTEVK